MNRGLKVMSSMVRRERRQTLIQPSHADHLSHVLLVPARLGVMNPSSEERAWVLGRVTPGHSGEALHLDPKVNAFAAEIEQRLARHRGGKSRLRTHARLSNRVCRYFVCMLYHEMNIVDPPLLIGRRVRMTYCSAVRTRYVTRSEAGTVVAIEKHESPSKPHMKSQDAVEP